MLFGFHSNRWTKEFKIFPSLFFGFEKPVLAIPNLAHLLLPSSDTNEITKSKELNYPPLQLGARLSAGKHALLTAAQSRRRPQAYGTVFLFFNIKGLNLPNSIVLV